MPVSDVSSLLLAIRLMQRIVSYLGDLPLCFGILCVVPTVQQKRKSGPRPNIKAVSPRYGDSYVKEGIGFHRRDQCHRDRLGMAIDRVPDCVVVPQYTSLSTIPMWSENDAIGCQTSSNFRPFCRKSKQVRPIPTHVHQLTRACILKSVIDIHIIILQTRFNANVLSNAIYPI